MARRAAEVTIERTVPASGQSGAADSVACTPAMLDGPLDRAEAIGLARVLKALADPARLQIVALLRTASPGDLCACDFSDPLGLAQPTISHHLKVLVEAGLVARRTEGTWAHFRLVDSRLAELAEVLW